MTCVTRLSTGRNTRHNMSSQVISRTTCGYIPIHTKVHGMSRVSNGAAIKAIRERTGITQPELARRVGITQGALSNIERGRNASPYTTRKIADELGVPFDAVTENVVDAVA